MCKIVTFKNMPYLGVPLIDGGTVRLPALIGLSRALDMILTGKRVGAQEALQIGKVFRTDYNILLHLPLNCSKDLLMKLSLKGEP